MTPTAHALSWCSLPPEALAFRTPQELEAHLNGIDDIEVTQFGASREGRPLFGYTLGRGPSTVSITAGCHADEPVGPMTAQALPWLIRKHAPKLLDLYTFRVAPQMNPDGAEQNREWFCETPDFQSYLRHAVRELPGDDVEFGFSTEEGARPECRDAIPFLWHASPVVAHFSLHGMAWAEGAWYLLNESWVDRAAPLMDSLVEVTHESDLHFHEIDRQGAKGFRRIRKGFATTPSSVAMKKFFHDQQDEETANKFLPSSMEMAMETGDDPLCMVSELPLFLLEVSPSLEEPVLLRFRDALETARATGRREDLTTLTEEFRLHNLAIETQLRLQFSMIVRGLQHVATYRRLPSR